MQTVYQNPEKIYLQAGHARNRRNGPHPTDWLALNLAVSGK